VYTETTEFQRKQLENEETAKRQRRNQNILLAANAAGTFVQARQTAKLSKAVGQLSNEISKQAQTLQRMEDTQSEILDETRRQTQLLELDNSRKLLERASQQAVFEFKVQVEEIETLDSNLEKYFTANACISSVNEQGINYENLPSISDKEYFYSTTKKLKSLSTEVLENLSDDEFSDLSKLDELRQKITALDKIKEKSETAKSSIQEINETSSADIAHKYELAPKSKRRITYGRTIVSILIGLGIVASADESSNNYDLMMGAGAIFLFGGILGFAWRLLSGIFSAGKSAVDGSSKELREKVADKKETLVKEIKEKFDKELSKVDIGMSETISLDNLDEISEEALLNIQNEFQSLMQKYPALRFELKQSVLHAQNTKSKSATIDVGSSGDEVANIVQAKLNIWFEKSIEENFILHVNSDSNVYIQGYKSGENVYVEAVSNAHCNAISSAETSQLKSIGWKENKNKNFNQKLPLECVTNGELSKLFSKTIDIYGCDVKIELEVI